MQASLPIVFVLVADPLGSGFVQNLGHPGFNLTGFSTFESSVGGKWLALLKEAAPKVSRIALLFNPETAPFAEGYLRSARLAAQALGTTVISAPCSNDADIQSAFTARARDGSGGIIGIADTFVADHCDLIIALAAQHRLPAIYGNPIFARDLWWADGLFTRLCGYLPSRCRLCRSHPSWGAPSGASGTRA
jgi:putative tryptophan/tyrosine transport system substrate-binding protein